MPLLGITYLNGVQPPWQMARRVFEGARADILVRIIIPITSPNPEEAFLEQPAPALADWECVGEASRCYDAQAIVG